MSQDADDSEDVLNTLRWADTIVLNKELISLNDRYSVEADGVTVGEIRGQYIYLLGDTFSLFSQEDNLVASEGEAYRLIHHSALLYDYSTALIRPREKHRLTQRRF